MAKPKKEETLDEGVVENVEVPAVVGEPQGSEIAVVNEADFEDEMMASAGAGQENITEEDLIIPRMKIVQALSKERKQSSDKYNPDAVEGMIASNLGELIPSQEGIIVLPVHFQKVYLEWEDDGSDAKLVKHHGTNDSVYAATPVNEVWKRVLADGHVISESCEFYVFIMDQKEGTFKPAIISMSGTGAASAKQWTTKMNQLLVKSEKTGKSYAPPSWYQPYKLTTKLKSNEKGEWFIWDISTIEVGEGEDVRAMNIKDFADWETIHGSAKKLNGEIQRGEVKVAAEESESAVEDDDDPM